MNYRFLHHRLTWGQVVRRALNLMSNFSFLGALFIFALCEHFSDIFEHRESQQHQQQNMFSREVSNLTAETFLKWPVWRRERALKKLWSEFSLSEESLQPYLDSKFDDVENIVDNKTDSVDNDFEAAEDYRLLAVEFRAKEHFAETLSHKLFLEKVFDKVGGRYFPHVTFNDVTRHDYSKVGSFTEIVGYTERWIWKNDKASSWQTALQHHYNHNSHHPEFHVDSNGVKRGKKTNPNDFITFTLYLH